MRNKILLSSFILLLSVSKTFSQITKREIAEKVVVKPRAYDSLTAFNPKEDLRIYIGQELYFLTKSKKWKNYKENSNDNFVGNYFVVDDFIDKTDKNKYKFNKRGLFFKLRDKKSNDTIYYKIAQYKEHLSDRMIIPFIIVSHFEKVQKTIIGQKFQLQKELTEVKEINTGNIFDIKKETWWECTDFTLVDFENRIYSRPVLIFRNELAQEIAVSSKGYSSSTKIDQNNFMLPEELKEKERLKNLKLIENKEKRELELALKKQREIELAEKEKKYREDCISKYGNKYGNYIVDGKVVIGMTEKMCSLSWGRPYNINTTTTNYGQRQQWVYSLKHYLYFENGKLVAIQN